MKRCALFVVIIMLTSGCASPRGLAAFEELFSDESWQEVPEGYQVVRGPGWFGDCWDEGSGNPKEPEGTIAFALVDPDLPRDDDAVVEHYRMIADGNGWTGQPSWPWRASSGNLLTREAIVNGVSFRMYLYRDDARDRYTLGFTPEPGTFCEDGA